jgi:hypothetical protein
MFMPGFTDSTSISPTERGIDKYDVEVKENSGAEV